MSELNEVLLGVFSAANGEIVGKIRTQKVFYLLEQLGLESGLRFSYHHFGPYSEQLSTQVRILEMFDPNFEESKRDNGFGGEFSVLSYDLNEIEPVEQIGKLSFEMVENSVQTMKSYSSKEIEIAATIHWLQTYENVDDWQAELKRRKTSKATEATIRRAQELLEELDLS